MCCESDRAGRPIRRHDTARADHFAQLAIQSDDTEPMALAVHGHIVSYLHKDFELAFRRFDAALEINRK